MCRHHATHTPNLSRKNSIQRPEPPHNHTSRLSDDGWDTFFIVRVETKDWPRHTHSHQTARCFLRPSYPPASYVGMVWKQAEEELTVSLNRYLMDNVRRLRGHGWMPRTTQETTASPAEAPEKAVAPSIKSKMAFILQGTTTMLVTGAHASWAGSGVDRIN